MTAIFQITYSIQMKKKDLKNIPFTPLLQLNRSWQIYTCPFAVIEKAAQGCVSSQFPFTRPPAKWQTELCGSKVLHDSSPEQLHSHFYTTHCHGGHTMPCVQWSKDHSSSKGFGKKILIWLSLDPIIDVHCVSDGWGLWPLSRSWCNSYRFT